jgi:NTP pyrophosphatase (non-canonical NTP hydrolase)
MAGGVMPSELKPEYYPVTPQQKLGYLIEECGEVLAAAGKTLRWGPGSVNPELPTEQQETNRDWLWRELTDLSRAIMLVRNVILEDKELEKEGTADE